MKPLKKGDLISIVSDCEYTAKIIFLNANHIVIQLQTPFGSKIGKSFPKEDLNKICYAVKTDDGYVTTDTGYKNAFTMLVEIARDESRLLENPLVLQRMVTEYYQRITEFIIAKKKFLGRETIKTLMDLKAKYFPKLTKLVFDEDLMENLEKYLSEHEGLSITKTTKKP